MLSVVEVVVRLPVVLEADVLCLLLDFDKDGVEVPLGLKSAERVPDRVGLGLEFGDLEGAVGLLALMLGLVLPDDAGLPEVLGVEDIQLIGKQLASPYSTM